MDSGLVGNHDVHHSAEYPGESVFHPFQTFNTGGRKELKLTILVLATLLVTTSALADPAIITGGAAGGAYQTVYGANLGYDNDSFILGP